MRVTARPPSASGFDMTTRPLSLETTEPCLPSGSWSTAMTSALVRMSSVSCWAVRRSAPISRGAAISAQRLKWVRYSVPVMPPLPTSSMSGSLKAPGLAYAESPWLACAMEIMLCQVSLMSPVVRQELPTGGAQFHGPVEPHSQML